MRLRFIPTRSFCAYVGVLVSLLPALFLSTSHSAPGPTSGESSAQPKAVGTPVENKDRAALSFAEAEGLRAEQRADSNGRAIEMYKDAAEAWRASAQFEKAASALRNAGEITQLLGDARSALSLYKESLILSQRAKSDLEKSRALNDLGYLNFIAGATDEAKRNCLEALRLGQAISNDQVVAQATSTLAETFYSFGELTKAIELQQQALAIWRRLGDQRGQSQGLVALGYYYSNLGEPAKARESCQQALNLARGTHDLRAEATALIADSYLKTKVGERQDALNSFGVARSLVETIGDRTSLAMTLGGLGDLYFALGDKQKALEHFLQSAKLYELSDQKWGMAEGKLVLGRIYHSVGDEKQALAYLREGLALFTALSMPRLAALTLRDIGLVYSSLKDNKSALSSYEQALKLTRTGQDQRYEAYTLNYIGRVYEDLKEYKRALAHYRRALPLNRIAVDQAGEVLTLFNIARVERDRGNLAEAQRQIEESTRIAESLRSNVSSQDLRASYFATVLQAYELYVDVLMQRHKANPGAGFAAQAFAISERARARSFLESLHESQTNIREGVDTSLLEKERTLEEALNAKAERQMQLLAGKNKLEAEKVGVEINSLTVEYAEVRDQIKATSPRYAALILPQPLDLTKTQQQVLDNESILLAYAIGGERSYVWVVTRTAASAYELPGRAEIETSAQRLYGLFTDFQMIPGESVDQHIARQAKASEAISVESARLSKLILGPLAGQLGKKRLLIIADGALQYIPFQALTDPDDSTKFLVVDHEIVNEPSASALALLIADAGGRKAAPDSVAVLADPVFEVDDPRVSRAAGEATPISPATLEVRKALRDIGISSDGAQVPRLFASSDEADAIMETLPWGTGLKAVGFAASRSRVLGGEMTRYRIIHFATHGLINNEHPDLSGIVLSLFDEQGRAQDGFLRLHDIYNLRLPADLVVLSACSTGLGKDVKGEGLVGLTRGFMYAGASGVVASLWKVDDEATAELMTHFYKAMFLKGLSPAAALRDSQLAMSGQKRWQAPYFWAGFVIQGQYLEKENTRHSLFVTGKRYAVFGAVIGILLLTSILIIIIRRRRGRTI
jgi:CHAT domain-containing protein